MIGIFKVNSKKDGGYFIDRYLESILNKNNLPTKAFVFDKSQENFDKHELISCNYKNIFAALSAFNQIVDKYSIQIFYTNQFITLLYGVLLRIFFRKKIKIIAKVDGKTIKIGIIKKLFFKIYDFLWNFAKNKSDFIIFETQNAKSNFSKENCKVIYTPAINFYQLDLENLKNQEIIKLEKSKYRKIILYVGRYSEEKGYFLLRDIAKNFSDCLFIMIGGKNNEFSDVKNIVEIGMLNISQIIPYYQFCDMLLVPSVDDSFPNVIREFAYFNKPIIATNVGSMTEFQDLGMKINIGPANLNEIIIELKRNIENDELNENKIIYEKSFNPNNENVIDNYLSIFQKFL